MSAIKAELEENSSISLWAMWVAIDESPAAIDCREFLDRALLGIEAVARRNALKRIRKGDEAQVDATLHELAAHELLRLLGLSPTMDPSVHPRLTPDLAIEINGQRYIADVFVSYSPMSTIEDSDDGTGWAEDDGDRARKIAGRLANKSSKYADLDLPLIQVVFLGDHRILSIHDVEVALYGVGISEFEAGDIYPKDIHFEGRYGGILLPGDDSPPYPHENLSAVLAVDWFDSLNRERRGRRFHCRLLNHYEPSVRLSEGAVAPFQEVRWHSVGEEAWRPEVIGASNTVARCGADPEIEFGLYSSDGPW